MHPRMQQGASWSADTRGQWLRYWRKDGTASSGSSCGTTRTSQGGSDMWGSFPHGLSNQGTQKRGNDCSEKQVAVRRAFDPSHLPRWWQGIQGPGIPEVKCVWSQPELLPLCFTYLSVSFSRIKHIHRWEVLELASKDCKITFINVFEDLQENMAQVKKRKASIEK